MRNCDAIADNMTAYQKLYNALEGSFDGCELNYITRAINTEADELANIGSTRGPIPPDVFLQSIRHRSIKPARHLSQPQPMEPPQKHKIRRDQRAWTSGNCGP